MRSNISPFGRGHPVRLSVCEHSRLAMFPLLVKGDVGGNLPTIGEEEPESAD
jgi:hypothetical protein